MLLSRRRSKLWTVVEPLANLGESWVFTKTTIFDGCFNYLLLTIAQTTDVLKFYSF